MSALATIDDLNARLPFGTIADDQTIRATALLEDVSAAVRAYTGQDFTLATSTNKRIRTTRNTFVRLPQRPVVSVSSVTDTDGNALTYTWDGFDRIEFGSWPINAWELNLPPWYGWPPTRGVLVTYEHGYATVPDVVVAVVCQIVGRAIGSPSTESGVTQEALGAYSYSRGGAAAAGPFGLLADERAVLDKFRTPGGAAYIGV